MSRASRVEIPLCRQGGVCSTEVKPLKEESSTCTSFGRELEVKFDLIVSALIQDEDYHTMQDSLV